MKPLVGITADYEESGEYKSRIKGEGRYILRRGYAKAVARSGGDPIIVPYDISPDNMIARLDALMVTGGDFDIPPKMSGIKKPSMARKVRPDRTVHEMELIAEAMKRGLPILGICGGMQLLAVYFGGKMIGDVLAEVKGAIDHEKEGKRDKPAHEVKIVDGTLLRKIVDEATVGVNSSHHQAVDKPGSMIVSAVAPDGIVEAVELPGHRFVVGVEWHPELMSEKHPPHRAIFDSFIRSAIDTQSGVSEK